MKRLTSAVRVLIFATWCALCVAETALEGQEVGEGGNHMAKRRRIIVNDDGDARIHPVSTDDYPPSEHPKVFLSRRFGHVKGAPVDSYFHCVGDGQEPPWGQPTFATIGDPNQVMVDAAHEAGMEIFASLRMNDTHDAFPSKVISSPTDIPYSYPLKLERPDVLVSADLDESRRKGDSVIRSAWTGLDYAHKEVRDQKFAFLDRICRTYDYDGLEMDFCRCPVVFKFGEERKHFDTMTGFIRRVRRNLEAIGEARGRPYPIAVRVPGTPALARKFGFDVETWMKEGLIDLLIIGLGNSQMSEPYHEFIEMAHRYGVLAYPCMNRWNGYEILRAAVSNYDAAGADGVYFFNYNSPNFGGDPPRWWKILRPGEKWQKGYIRTLVEDIADPATLAGLDKLYELEWRKVWTKYQYAVYPHPLPVRLVECRSIKLVVGDDLEAASRNNRLKDLRLQVRVSWVNPDEWITLDVNGVPVASGEGKPAPGYKDSWGRTVKSGCWYDVDVGAPPLRKGENQIVVALGKGAVGRGWSTVDRLQLLVRYK